MHVHRSYLIQCCNKFLFLERSGNACWTVASETPRQGNIFHITDPPVTGGFPSQRSCETWMLSLLLTWTNSRGVAALTLLRCHCNILTCTFSVGNDFLDEFIRLLLAPFEYHCDVGCCRLYQYVIISKNVEWNTAHNIVIVFRTPP